ncbi:MAG TPA: AroM family protein [Candidatus Ventrousia excrementavium]|uniref:AroM family protein n=1 Tax=Candidatus Ventrousia excrementavium TaxID=2840961 RepID=A0A9D1IV38_9CLOT|nr:AroM family protein [Candidatus Ventrousia excrementavium]
MIRIGALTIGQSPRVDVTADIAPILEPEITLLEAGALDGLTADEIAALRPCAGEQVLVSRLRDGTQAVMAEPKLVPLLQRQIDRLQAQGVPLIVMLCTGEFPPGLHADVPLLYPSRLLDGVVRAAASRGRIAVIAPDEAQLPLLQTRWAAAAPHVELRAASPYGDPDNLRQAAASLRGTDVDLVVLDCIGYTAAMRDEVCALSGLPAALPRTLIARVVRDLLGV